MNPNKTYQFDGISFANCCHVCGFFNSRQQQYKVLMHFIKEGLERGEKAFHIIDQRLHSDHLDRLRKGGIDVDRLLNNGQLEVTHWEKAYLRGTRFDQNAMLALIEEILTRGRSDGYPLTRFIANMEWSLEDFPGVSDILEYESRLNHILPKYKDAVVCTYDLTRFPAELVIDMLRVHPVAIVGETFNQNPFYVPPDQFIQELNNRIIA